MPDPEAIKTAIERNQKALRLRPSIGRGTAVTSATVRAGGMTCDIEDGSWKLVADESTGGGGAGLGPDPGVFGRAALASCLAIAYVMWAAYRGVPIDSVQVDVEADYDASGLYGVDEEAPRRWTAMRYKTRIASPAPEQQVREMAEYADAHSSLLNAFRDPIPITGSIEISSPVER
jgi:uncharacterized OsmC-like protein